MAFPAVAKMALRLAAGERMRAGGYGISPCPTEPRINRRHIDGPYLSALDGQIRWLSLWERLLTKVGIWDAWDVEWRQFPLALAAGSRRAKTAQRVECEASQSGGRQTVTPNSCNPCGQGDGVNRASP